MNIYSQIFSREISGSGCKRPCYSQRSVPARFVYSMSELVNLEPQLSSALLVGFSSCGRMLISFIEHHEQVYLLLHEFGVSGRVVALRCTMHVRVGKISAGSHLLNLNIETRELEHILLVLIYEPQSGSTYVSFVPICLGSNMVANEQFCCKTFMASQQPTVECFKRHFTDSVVFDCR